MIQNNPELKGQLAAYPTYLHGGRFAIYPVHTRFEDICWMVADAETMDPLLDMPEIIFQSAAKESAEIYVQEQIQKEFDKNMKLHHNLKRREAKIA